MATLLAKFLDAGQWEAEDLVGRLGLVAHVAFLHAGLVPYGAEPPSGGHLLKRPGSTFLCRWYTAPELARRDDAEAAVLMLCAESWGRRDVALLMYLTVDRRDDNVRRRTYRQSVDAAALAPLLSRRLDEAEPWGSRLCRALADGPCWGLRVELCRGNVLPLTGFMSLPPNVMVRVLERLAAGGDLARVQCTSRLLSRLVAEHDVELWKPVYEASVVVSEDRPWWKNVALQQLRSSGVERAVVGWKWRYVLAWHWQRILRTSRCWCFVDVDDDPDLIAPSALVAPAPFTEDDGGGGGDDDNVVAPPPASMLPDDDGLPEERRERIARGKSASAGHRRKVARNDDYKKLKKRHAAGAIHSPSSRYRWNHR